MKQLLFDKLRFGTEDDLKKSVSFEEGVILIEEFSNAKF